ncbi:MAG: hypothetical protein VX777_01930 [Chlamydiota bacterium]|nr:hypothetical protein [Chlamydiota bacterium]
MGFNLKSIDQCAISTETAKLNMSKHFYNLSKNSKPPSRFVLIMAGFSIGLSVAILNIAEAVARVGECTIKGISNLFGAPFTGKCCIKKAGKQLLLQLPLSILCLIISPIGLFYQPILFIIGFASSPKNFNESLANSCKKKITDYQHATKCKQESSAPAVK